MQAPVFSLVMPSESRMLSLARGFVEAVTSGVAVDEKIVHALVIVTGEAVTNIIRHAHRDLETAAIEIQLQLFTDCIVLSFKDQGEPFDLATVPHLPPGDLRVGGRGIYLMRTLTDELTYEPCDPGRAGNLLRLVKRCPLESVKRECG